MSFISQLKIGPRLGAGFAIVLLLLCAVGAVGLLESSSIYDGTREIADSWLPSIETLANLRNKADDVHRLTVRELQSTDANQMRTLRARRAEAVTAFAGYMAVYSHLISSPDEERLHESIKSAWASYLETSVKIDRLLDAGEAGLPEARQLSAVDASTRFAALQSVIDKDIKLNHDGYQRENRPTA